VDHRELAELVVVVTEVTPAEMEQLTLVVAVVAEQESTLILMAWQAGLAAPA
jgi:hypothetical protein